MGNASKSMAVFGVYLVISGLGLMFIPNTLITLIGLPPTNDIWIRLLGAITGILGLYYIQAARENNLAFFRMTVWGRILVFVSFVSLVLRGVATPIIILIGLVDFSCALWTWLAIQRTNQTIIHES